MDSVQAKSSRGRGIVAVVIAVASKFDDDPLYPSIDHVYWASVAGVKIILT